MVFCGGGYCAASWNVKTIFKSFRRSCRVRSRDIKYLRSSFSGCFPTASNDMPRDDFDVSNISL